MQAQNTPKLTCVMVVVNRVTPTAIFIFQKIRQIVFADGAFVILFSERLQELLWVNSVLVFQVLF